MGVEVVGKGGIGDGAAEGGEIELGRCVYDVDGGLEEGVDYVDEAAREGEVLEEEC